MRECCGGSVTSVSVNRWWNLELGCCVLRLRSSSTTTTTTTGSRSLWGFSVVIWFSVVNFLLLSVGLCCEIWPELEVCAAEILGVWVKKEGNACVRERERESQREFLCFFLFHFWNKGWISGESESRGKLQPGDGSLKKRLWILCIAIKITITNFKVLKKWQEVVIVGLRDWSTKGRLWIEWAAME